MVGFNFVESYDKNRLGRRLASVIGKCEGALPDTYGKKVEVLARLMNDCLAEVKTTGGEQPDPEVQSEGAPSD